MAIKGKSKGRSAKAVTRGPRPAYVPVKRPLLARRGFWVGIAVGLSALLVVGLVLGFAAQRNRDRQERLDAAMAKAVDGFQTQLDPILAAVGQSLPPSGYQAFADLSAAVDQLEKDSKDAPADLAAIATTAGNAITGARSATDALDAIDETALVRGKGFDETFVLYLINAKGNMLRSMRLYEQVGDLLESAAGAEGAQRAAFLGAARGVLNVASETFARGYADFVEAQTRAGTFVPSTIPGLPAPTGAS